MKIDTSKQYKFDTPLIFTDGTNLYSEIKKDYLTHDFGLFILAPSGSGKTYFVERQKENNWIDGDELWIAAHAHPKFGWWNEPVEVINRVESQSDIITLQAKNMGFWILGSANHWLKPDAIVIPDWEVHQKYIKHREENNYDGGATSENLLQLQNHIQVISEWSKQGVPKFKSIEEAVKFLTRKDINGRSNKIRRR